MADWELLDADPTTGVRKFIAAGEEPDSVLVRYEHNDTPVVERNKAVQNDSWNRKGDFWHAASIPVGVMYRWLVEHGVNAWDYAKDPDVRRKVNQLLNSNEYRYLRVRNFIL